MIPWFLEFHASLSRRAVSHSGFTLARAHDKQIQHFILSIFVLIKALLLSQLLMSLVQWCASECYMYAYMSYHNALISSDDTGKYIHPVIDSSINIEIMLLCYSCMYSSTIGSVCRAAAVLVSVLLFSFQHVNIRQSSCMSRFKSACMLAMLFIASDQSTSSVLIVVMVVSDTTMSTGCSSSVL